MAAVAVGVVSRLFPGDLRHTIVWPGRADGCPSGPPTDPYVRNARIRFLKQSLSYPSILSSGGVVTRLASAAPLSCLVPTGTLCPTSPSLPGVAWVSLPHFPRYYAPLRLPPVPLGVLCLSLVPRYRACFRCSWCPIRARRLVEAPDVARVFGHPVPHSGSCARRQMALPSSRVPPVKTCPALRPRWCPERSPVTRPGLLPSSACKPSAYHDYTHFGAPSRGLPSRYPRLRTAPYGEARGFAPDLLARR